MWVVKQSTGELFAPNRTLVCTGWSGRREGKNNPAWQSVKGFGPLPVGFYDIGDAYNHPHLGPVTMNLTPMEGTNTFGRSQFACHGWAADNPETEINETEESSHGCYVCLRTCREIIARSKDKQLLVVL